MNNSDLICKKNLCQLPKKINNISLNNGKIEVVIRNAILNNQLIVSLIKYVKYIERKYPMKRIPVRFILDNVILTDKLAYVLLECIVESLITDYHRRVEVFINVRKKIITEGISSSPIVYLGDFKKRSIDEKDSEFLKRFNYEHYKRHFRRVVNYKEYKDSNKLSKLYDEVANFQKLFRIDMNCIEEISEVIVELVGNAIEHSRSDCLIDFDIADDYINNNNESVCGINIAILSFSNILLGDGICEKLSKGSFNTPDASRYAQVLSAFNNHKALFDSDYDETDFHNITTFQNKISGSLDKIDSGGMGLTKLIKSIEERSDEHTCYALSGDRIIMFYPKHLEYNSEGWISFNGNNNYFTSQPSPEVIEKSSFYMPGTAFNLNFVMKGE